MWRASLSLFHVLFSCILVCNGQFPIGQVCSAGKKCVPISSCPEMVRLVQSGTQEGIRRVRQSICGFRNRQSLVCCSSDGPSNTTPRPFILGTRPTRPLRTSLLPPPEMCGRPRVGDKIVGGAPAPLGSYPWMAAMGYTEPGVDGVSFICTGTLINSKYVLTAAHCVNEQELGRKRLSVIHLGDWDLNNHGQDCQVTRLETRCRPPRILAGPESITMHPQYDTRGRASDDIALIRLNITIDFDTVDADVEPVCLPQSNLDVRGLIGNARPIAAGWGLTEYGNHSNIMLRVNVPIVNDDLCKQRYEEYFVGDQICVGGERGFDTCTGDSGGPLIIPESDGPPYTQIGIVSYGPFPCGLDQFPGVYISVKKYMDWIVKNLRP